MIAARAHPASLPRRDRRPDQYPRPTLRHSRETERHGSFTTAPYFATSPITSVTDHQIACRFDREKMIDFSGSGLPPVGYDIGGMSGAPLLMHFGSPRCC
jgi:hypothetical protein